MKKCEVCGNDYMVYKNEKTGKYLCRTHYQQVYKNGKVQNRTHLTPNEIIEHDDYAEVALYNIRYEETGRTIIDKNDIEKVKQYKWRLSDGRVMTTIGRKNIFLHRYILDAPKNKKVDHINRNPLDNRRHNLRLCTTQENNRNKRMLNENTSGVTGVYYSKRDKKWIAQIKINNKGIHLGAHEDLEYAKAIRLKAEQIAFKDFSPNKHLFFIIKQYEGLKNIKTLDELRSYLNVGYNNGNVLDEHQVREIKQLLADGRHNQSQIARMYNVNKTTINRIKLGKTWAWVELKGGKSDEKQVQNF